MAADIQVTTLRGEGTRVTINDLPNVCPVCHTSIHPQLVTANLILDGDRSVEGVFRCTPLRTRAQPRAVVSFSGTSDAGHIQFTFNQDTACSPTEFTGTLVGTTLAGTFRRTCPPLTEVTAWTARHVAGRTSIGPSSTSETR